MQVNVTNWIKYPSGKDGVALYSEPHYIWAYIVLVPIKAALQYLIIAMELY
jgi:hypothetical protein